MLKLLRPLDVVLFFFAAALGGVLTVEPGSPADVSTWRALAALSAAALVGGGSNVVNDIYDIEIDQTNRPDRPLASGRVGKRSAWILWGAVSVLGVALGFWASAIHGVIALLSVVLLWAYSAFVKQTVLLGNLTVAVVVTLGVVYGGLALGPPTEALWAGCVLAFWILFAREIAKDVQDVEGDRDGGAQTLPVRWGSRKSLRLVVAMIAAAICLLPVVAVWVGEAFFVYGIAIAIALLSAWWVSLSPMSDDVAPRLAARVSSALKVALGVGILALALARWNGALG